MRRFRFDNNTWDSIVCSEPAFQTYVEVRWSAGRPFELVTFIHDGRVVHARTSGLMAKSTTLCDRRRVLPSRDLAA